MKNRLKKDFYREIRKNKGRFLSILFIVMLGTAFFSGVRSAGSDMKYSADDLYRRSNMMDIRVLGTLGLSEEDLADIRAIRSVEQAEGAYTKEVLANRIDEQLVLKLIAETKGVNEVVLMEGRLPQKPNECVTDAALSEYKIGDVIRVESGTEAELSEDLKVTEFTVVGKGNLPYHMDLTRGSGTIGNGRISGFLVIPKDAFDMDVYTEIYVQVRGAGAYNSYSDEYEKLVDATAEEIEDLEDTLSVRRYNEVIADGEKQIKEAKDEIDDGQRELDDAKAELDDAKKELEDGKKELDDAENELIDGKKELDDAEKELNDGKVKLDDAKRELEDGKVKLDDAKQQVDDGEAELIAAKQELDDGEKELAEAWAGLEQAKTEIDDGEKQLKEAKEQLDRSKKEIEDGEAELKAAKKELDEKKPELEEAKKTLDEAKAGLDEAKTQLDDGKEQLSAGKAELDEALAELEKNQAELDAAHAQADAGKQALDEGWTAYEEGKAQLDEQKELLETAKTGYAVMQTQLEALKQALELDPENEELIARIAGLTVLMENTKAQIDTGEAAAAEAEATLAAVYDELSEKQAEWEEGEAQLAAADKLLAEGMEQYQAGKEEYDGKLAEYEAGVKKYEDGKAEYESGLAQYKAGKKLYDAGVAAYEKAVKEFEEGKAQYEEGLASYEKAVEEFENGKTQYEEGLAEYEKGKKKWEDGKRQYEEGLQEWQNGKRQYEEALVEYEEGVQKYEDGLKDYEDGLKEYEDGKKEYEDGLKEFEDGKKEYEDGLKEYEDGEKEYQDAYDEHMPEIEDGRKEVADAEEELRKIKVPDLYVLDRSMIQSSASFGQDAERMDSLGNVFPVIFFLVAALVSLTAMTRMVDEQRQQIGTLKALGFSGWAITWKYLKYALIPSLIGGVIGVALGEYIIPKVIIDAYRMMYTGLDQTRLAFNAKEGVSAVLIACACTAAAAMAACYRKLRDKPAELMRPEAPKSGRRVFLEYVKPVWNRINFTAKSTVRNLFRYKKRLLMTIIGIGACMGLMMVGFGLNDSIKDVAKRQYREIFMQDAYVSVDVNASASERARLQETVDRIEGMTKSMDLAEISGTLHYGKTDRSAVLYIPENTEDVSEFLRFQSRTTMEPYDFPKEGVGLAEKTADMLGVRVGDTIVVQKGENGKKAEATVAVIAENYVQHYCFMTPETYRNLFDEEVEFNEVLLKYDDTSKENEERIGKILIAEDACTSVSFTTDFQKQIDDMLETLTFVIWVLIVSAGLLAFVVLYNLNNINIMERKRELATLKVLGFQNMEVAMYVYRENMILTVLGILLGCFIGMVLHRFTILTVEVDLMMFGRSVRAGSYVISALLTLLFAVVVNTSMYFSLKKIDMIESLKSVE